MREGIKVYTILRTAMDSDRGDFPPPDAVASFLSLEKAKTELRELIAETERSDTLNPALNKRDSGEDYWEAYEEGNETARYCRLEILTSELKDGQEESLKQHNSRDAPKKSTITRPPERRFKKRA